MIKYTIYIVYCGKGCGSVNFLILFNEKKDRCLSVAVEVADFFAKKGGKVYMEESVRGFSETKIPNAHYFGKELPEELCAAVVIGGDGTILRAARLLYGRDIPIVGINLGTVGYLTELEVGECELLEKLFELRGGIPAGVSLDERMMLSFRVVRGDKTVREGVALNEVVLAKGEISRMIDVDLSHDESTVTSYQCDGVIVSTPTGSTAYSLSAGGTIMDPELSCIGVVPLCPYLAIYSGPILFSEKAHIELRFHARRGSSAYLSADGKDNFPLCDGDRILCCAAEHKARLLRFKNTDFYKLLNTKLKNRMLMLTDGVEKERES